MLPVDFLSTILKDLLAQGVGIIMFGRLQILGGSDCKILMEFFI